jgi:hypothetical protein
LTGCLRRLRYLTIHWMESFVGQAKKPYDLGVFESKTGKRHVSVAPGLNNRLMKLLDNERDGGGERCFFHLIPYDESCGCFPPRAA